jgi:hypothetical protein
MDPIGRKKTGKHEKSPVLRGLLVLYWMLSAGEKS